MPYRLPASIYSSTQLRQLQSELKRLGALRSPKNLVFSENLVALAEANKVTKLNLTIIRDMQKFVNESLAGFQEITVTLACEPTIEERNDLIANLRRMLTKELLVHFIIQPELLAGATIRTKSGFYDLSLRSALFSNKTKLMAELKNA